MDVSIGAERLNGEAKEKRGTGRQPIPLLRTTLILSLGKLVSETVVRLW
jgi:hypothetical protein